MDLAGHSGSYREGHRNYSLIMTEFAIMATDIAEVIGAAIALNLLFHIPLVPSAFHYRLRRSCSSVTN